MFYMLIDILIDIDICVLPGPVAEPVTQGLSELEPSSTGAEEASPPANERVGGWVSGRVSEWVSE